MNHSDRMRIQRAYDKWFDDFILNHEMNQLITLRDSKTLRGTRLSALLEAIARQPEILNKIASQKLKSEKNGKEIISPAGIEGQSGEGILPDA